jgi:hypothetical protein
LKLFQKVKLFIVFPTIPVQNLVSFGHQEGHCFEFQSLEYGKTLKNSEKRQDLLASGPRWPKAACPGQRVPTRARRLRGGSVTTRYLTPALSTARHLCSTRSPCSRRLHVRVVPLSHIAATPRPVPLLFLGSRQALALLCSAFRRAPLLQASSANHQAPPSCAS